MVRSAHGNWSVGAAYKMVLCCLGAAVQVVFIVTFCTRDFSVISSDVMCTYVPVRTLVVLFRIVFGF